LGALADALCDRAVERACLPGDEPLPRDRFAYDLALERGRGEVYGVAMALAARAKAVLKVAREIEGALARLPAGLDPATAADCRRELERLAGPGFAARTPDPWFDQLPRLLAGLQARVTSHGAGRLMTAERDLQQWRARVARRTDAPPGDETAWLLAEYCVSLFAQRLGTSVPISAKRLERFLAGTTP
jgi:ATP-dependent helicase HrpA